MDTFTSLDWFLIATSLAKTIFLIFLVVLPMVSYTVYAERRVSALIQDRLGPNRTGFPTSSLGIKNDCSPFLGGLGQPVADAREIHAQGRFHAGARKQILLLARARPRRSIRRS